MSADEARTLLAYTRWANDLMLEAVGALSDEQFTRDLNSSFPSVRDTLVHLAGADWLWLERWNGRWHGALPDDWTDLSFADIATRWRDVQGQRAEMFANATDDDMRRPVSYRNIRGEAFTQRMDALIRHVVNHSTYHRGQITTMLRQLGAVAPSTDYVVYDRLS
jgi:uncharacterized damage-inducible protein DinB